MTRLRVAALAVLLLAGCEDPSRLEAPQAITPEAPEQGPVIERLEISGPHQPESMSHYVLQVSKRIATRCRAGSRAADLHTAIASSGHVLEARVEGGDWLFDRCARRVLDVQRYPRRGGRSLVYAAIRFR